MKVPNTFQCLDVKGCSCHWLREEPRWLTNGGGWSWGCNSRRLTYSGHCVGVHCGHNTRSHGHRELGHCWCEHPAHARPCSSPGGVARVARLTNVPMTRSREWSRITGVILYLQANQIGLVQLNAKIIIQGIIYEEKRNADSI